jgi:NAD+ synthase
MKALAESLESDDPMSLNGPLVEKILVGFVHNEVRRVGFSRVVLGLSGGIDSTLSAYIAVRALGPENVCGIRMPYSTSSRETMDHAELVARETGVRMMTISIADQIDAYFRAFPDASRLRRANKMARERMTILYDQSAAQNALVLGTSNKTELLLGYGTIFGDMASALNPIGDLYKTQVRTLSAYMGVPSAIIEKNPTADLWAGQTDEAELGFTYADVDRLLIRMVDQRAKPDDLITAGFAPEFVSRIARMIQTSHYKRRLPLIAKISHRTIDRDFRYARDWGT